MDHSDFELKDLQHFHVLNVFDLLTPLWPRVNETHKNFVAIHPYMLLTKFGQNPI